MLRKVLAIFREVVAVALWCLALAALQVILAVWIPLGLRQNIASPLAIFFWLSMGVGTFLLYAGFQQVHRHWTSLVESIKNFRR